GIASSLQPLPDHALAVTRAGQQSVNFGLRIVDCGLTERGHLVRARGKASQVERQAAQESVRLRLGRWGEALFLQARQEEGVDGIAYPRGVLDRRRYRPARGDECPVDAPGRTLVDPALECLDLGRSERLLGARRRHDRLGILVRDPLDDLAVAALAGDD